MKVVFVTSWFPSRLDATNGNFVERHALSLVSVGHEVIVVHEHFSNRFLLPRIETSTASGLPVYHIFMPRFLKNKLRLRKSMVDTLLNKYPEIFKRVEIVHGHVIHPVGAVAQYLAHRLETPLFFTEHWSGFLPRSNFDITASELASIKEVALDCEVFMPVSEVLKGALQEKGILAKYKVVYNTVDTTKYKLNLSKKEKGFTFLHVSNFANVKNVRGIMCAFESLISNHPDLNPKLIIAGDGDVAEIEYFRKGLNPKAEIEIFGTRTYEEVALLMKESNCFVLFSAYETFGVVVAESLCCGVPVIATNVGGIPEMVDSTNGILVDANDEEALESAMLQMMSGQNVFLPEKIAASAAERYSYHVIGSSYSQVYQDAISNP